MFAVKPRKVIALNAIVIVAMLFNSFASVPVSAQEPDPTSSSTPSPTATSTEALPDAPAPGATLTESDSSPPHGYSKWILPICL